MERWVIFLSPRPPKTSDSNSTGKRTVKSLIIGLHSGISYISANRKNTLFEIRWNSDRKLLQLLRADSKANAKRLAAASV